MNNDHGLPATQRLWVLDLARAPAALLVIAFHCLGTTTAHESPSDPSLPLVGWMHYGGVFGVNVFFFLSGFVTHLTTLRRRELEEVPVSWSQYLARRFWRIYPLYLAAIVLSVSLESAWAVVRHRSPMEYLPGGFDLAAHLLLVHTWFPSTFFGIVPALWFVGVVAQFYALYPVFVGLSRRWGEMRAAGVVLIGTIIGRLLCWQASRGTSPDSSLYEVLWMNAPTRWFEWVFGAWMAKFIFSGHRIPALAGIASLVFALIWLVAGEPFPLFYHPVFTVLIGTFLGALATNVRRSSPQTGFESLLWLGEISYALYLLHQVFVPYVASGLASRHLAAAAFCLTIFLIVCVITLPLAYLLHRWIELPLAKGFGRKTPADDTPR